jgi:REP element-mobilizing transposase RayT
MGNSYISNYVHYVYTTKNHKKYLTKKIREKLFPYIGGICKENSLKLIKAGGIEDHLHLLVSLPATITIAKSIQFIKGGSSRWIHETFKNINDLEWQEGYGAFSIGVSQIDHTIKYISNQEEHHRKISFRDEFISILNLHGIEFEEKYLL